MRSALPSRHGTSLAFALLKDAIESVRRGAGKAEGAEEDKDNILCDF